MFDKLSGNKTFKMLESALNISKQRHSILVSNVANLDTPGAKAKDIDFKSAMENAMTRGQQANMSGTDMGHISLKGGPVSEADVVEEKGEWNGYNYMNTDQVLIKLTENNLIYRAAVESLMRKINIMKEVLKEGGR